MEELTPLEKARLARKNSGYKKEDTVHTVRTKDGGTKDITNLTRKQAILMMCSECLGWGEAHPKDCSSYKCPLFPFKGQTQFAYKATNGDATIVINETETETEERDI